MTDREVPLPARFPHADTALTPCGVPRPDRYTVVVRHPGGGLRAAFGRWTKRALSHLVQPHPTEYH